MVDDLSRGVHKFSLAYCKVFFCGRERGKCPWKVERQERIQGDTVKDMEMEKKTKKKGKANKQKK